MAMKVLATLTYAYHVYVWFRQKSKEGMVFLATGIIYSCELSGLCWELSCSPPKEPNLALSHNSISKIFNLFNSCA